MAITKNEKYRKRGKKEWKENWIRPSHFIWSKGISHSFLVLHSKNNSPKPHLNHLVYHSNSGGPPKVGGSISVSGYCPSRLSAGFGSTRLGWIRRAQNGHCPSRSTCGIPRCPNWRSHPRIGPCSRAALGGWTKMRASTRPVGPNRTRATNAHALGPSEHAHMSGIEPLTSQKRGMRAKYFFEMITSR